VRAVPARDVAAIVNTGDDMRFYGVHVSPDVDIVTYTLAGRVDRARGYGLEGDTTAVIEALGAIADETWFRLGDRDFAHCHHRTLRLAQGVGLAAIADELRRALGVATRVLVMSEDPCPTNVVLTGGRRVHFEEYLARDGAPDDVTGVDLSAARRARPGPGVLDAIAHAEVILVCPSNPIVSIGPILAVPGVREALRKRRADVAAVCPLVAGKSLKGPSDKMMAELGQDVSAVGVASLYSDVCGTLIIDHEDEAASAAVKALGMRAVVRPTVMKNVEDKERLARHVLALFGR